MFKIFRKYHNLIVAVSEKKDGPMKFSKENRKRFLDKLGIDEKRTIRAGKYSKAFLHCYNSDLDKASASYARAFRGKLPESEKFLKDVISFIEEIIKDEPDKIQLYFALGKIYYQKLYNLPEASRNYEKFLSATDPKDPRFTKKIKMVRDYKEKIDEKLMHGF